METLWKIKIYGSLNLWTIFSHSSWNVCGNSFHIYETLKIILIFSMCFFSRIEVDNIEYLADEVYSFLCCQQRWQIEMAIYDWQRCRSYKIHSNNKHLLVVLFPELMCELWGGKSKWVLEQWNMYSNQWKVVFIKSVLQC